LRKTRSTSSRYRYPDTICRVWYILVCSHHTSPCDFGRSSICN